MYLVRNSGFSYWPGHILVDLDKAKEKADEQFGILGVVYQVLDLSKAPVVYETEAPDATN